MVLGCLSHRRRWFQVPIDWGQSIYQHGLECRAIVPNSSVRRASGGVLGFSAVSPTGDGGFRFRSIGSNRTLSIGSIGRAEPDQVPGFRATAKQLRARSPPSPPIPLLPPAGEGELRLYSSRFRKKSGTVSGLLPDRSDRSDRSDGLRRWAEREGNPK